MPLDGMRMSEARIHMAVFISQENAAFAYEAAAASSGWTIEDHCPVLGPIGD